VKIKVAWIGKSKEPATQALTDEYLKRISRFAEVEGVVFKNEEALLKMATQDPRGKSTVIILDSRGTQYSSEEFAKFIGDYRDRNPLPLLFAVGPADGFSESPRRHAAKVISLGKMTLPHELARVILLEQIYRAFTILAGHPYHSGH
jgi:23S rRNA (pseudouridine1915-N3)-methyltransferase